MKSKSAKGFYQDYNTESECMSVVPQNRFRDLVEATLRVKQSTTAMYQSRQESKRSAPGTFQ